VFVSNIYYPPAINEKINESMPVKAHGNNLLVNRGDGTFDETSREYGVTQGGWGWAAAAADFDNDGDRDLFHATRRMSFRYSNHRLSESEIRRIKLTYPFYSYPAVWERRGDTFVRKRPQDAGFTKTNGRGVASLDFDRDGDVDLIVANADGEYRVYENANGAGSALQVALVGDGAATTGARVAVTTGGETRFRVRNAKADYLSQDSRVLHVGTGNNTRATVRVAWPDGTETTVSAVRTDQRIYVSPGGVVKTVDLATG
jgi:hypothetical protein